MNNILNEMIAKTKTSQKQTDKQKIIAEVAIRLFAEKGYANTSTSEIAKEAGVAEGTIFRHYKTKENLLLALILPFMKESIPTMAENVFQQLSPDNLMRFEDFLKALLINRIQFIQANKEIFQVFVKELLYSEQLRNEILPIFTENVLKRLRSVIDTYKERGELVDLPTSEIQKILFTFFGGYFLSRFILGNEPVNEEAEINHLIQFALDGVVKH